MVIGIIVLKKDGTSFFYVNDGKRLKTIERSKLFANTPEAIWVVAECTELIVYKVRIPSETEQSNISQILENELLYLLPLELNDVCWGYRHNVDNEFLIYVMRKDCFTSHLDMIEKNSWCCDFFCPILPGAPLDDIHKFIPVTMTVPAKFFPIRNKTYRILYFLLLAAVLILCVCVTYGKYKVFKAECEQYKIVSSQKKQEFKQIEALLGKLRLEKNIWDHLGELNIKLSSILPILQELSVMLPRHMWITNYVQNGNVIDVTVCSSQDELNFFRLLSKAENFKIVNLRKSRGNNSTVMFYIKLLGDSQ